MLNVESRFKVKLIMRIGEVAKKFGISTSAIRFYERHGLIGAKGVNRRGNGYRNYSSQDVEIVSLICKLKDAGLELEEIKTLVCEASKNCGDLIASIDSQLEKFKKAADLINVRISNLELARLRCLGKCSVEDEVKNCCG